MSSIGKITKGMEKKYWAAAFFCPVTMILEVVFETVIPYLMSLIIDTGIKNRDIKYILIVSLIMCICSVFSLSAGIAGGRLGAVASQGMSHNLRTKLFNKVQTFSFGNVDHFSTASLVTRLTTDVTNIQNVFMLIIRISFRAPFMLLSGTIMAFILNRNLALVFLFAIPFLGILISYLSAKAYPRFSKMLEKYDRLNTIVQENLIAIRVVKAFVRGERESEKFEKAADELRTTQVNAEKVIVRLPAFMQLTVYGTLIAVFWFGGNMVIRGSMESGKLISFLTYVTQILMSLMMLGMIFVNIVLSRASIRRVTEVLDEKPEITEKADGIEEVKDGSVDFIDVSFSYGKDSKNKVLSGINLHIDSGSVVGIIGSTGSSKTTLVNLIPRLYDTLSGQVLVGGKDVKDYKLIPLRDAVSVVLQKNVLFSGTIEENLRWGNKNASFEEIVRCAEAADAHSFIDAFPEKYDTDLGQGGVNLSGGQKQRICIARALLKKPKILILDDSTSAVDTATEKRIRTALRNGSPETTKIIIAQRISSVMDADMIVVMDDGKISGIGKHDELLLNNKIYREVYESQQSFGDADL